MRTISGEHLRAQVPGVDRGPHKRTLGAYAGKPQQVIGLVYPARRVDLRIRLKGKQFGHALGIRSACRSHPVQTHGDNPWGPRTHLAGKIQRAQITIRIVVQRQNRIGVIAGCKQGWIAECFTAEDRCADVEFEKILQTATIRYSGINPQRDFGKTRMHVGQLTQLMAGSTYRIEIGDVNCAEIRDVAKTVHHIYRIAGYRDRRAQRFVA